MRTEHGFSLVEMLGALAVGAIMTAGAAGLVDGYLEEGKGRQAALYQSRVTEAARKYISANTAALQTAAGATTPAVVALSALKTKGHLESDVQPVNAYGQTPCVLVVQPTAGRLEALVVTEGGRDIPAKYVAQVAASAGQGGGFIPFNNPTIAQGAANAWSVPLAGFGGASCSGTPAAANHLASALFFDGPGQLSTDFLHRHAVPGHPELNEMTTPLNMRAQAVEDASDALCAAGDASGYGRIAVDAQGAVLSCRQGIWKRQGGQWKDPAASFAALPVTGNSVGDVRLTTDTGRAFSWSGSAWRALAVDENGNLQVEGRMTASNVMLNQIVTPDSACGTNGLLARDTDGMPMACQLGAWRKLAQFAITGTAFSQSYVNTPPTGNTFNADIPLASLPGTRPLFITGSASCTTSDRFDSRVRVSFVDAAGAYMSYAGGCITDSSNGKGRVHMGTFIALQEIPDGAASVHVYMHTNGLATNNTQLQLAILNSR
ncbi:shufflon system plasmid conjugative transfer pilus tip adhesin PilV [Noviherbaspirillum saxi]|uniref:Shufflon system plasmid conjugative transfer pilus tip adhesin PilV n=1 Tax=Noviherbaspirillum saxi TaxID=2320863 RepID=A0A3A3G0D1_9BURK|nr:shufflon system plasmid conjugative transfer pilus tip adhesin PilV [Noviherbaspirillum saxi]RJF92789.1 shufflon system plasmid conjugative transfer pilus tip adhesin PilV [Noviherbaspirillum saxi]